MDRRSVLRALGVSSALFAGCGGPNEGGRFGETETTTEQRPARELLRAVGRVTFESGRWAVLGVVENTSTRSITARFEGEVYLPDLGERLTTESREETVAGEQLYVLSLDLAGNSTLPYRVRTGLQYEGYELRLLVDGEPEPGICPDQEFVAERPEGCRFTVPNETYISITYPGDWSGSVTVDRESAPVSRGDDGAPEGVPVSYIDVVSDAELVAASVSKGDPGAEPLTVELHHRGEVLARATSERPDDVAFLSTELPRGPSVQVG